jgi:sugar transferase (PEP-CTERM/EpsH1 system associated)
LKLLVLTSRFPYPLEKGDKLRIYYQLRELAKSHEIVLCALTEEQPTPKDFKVIQSFCSKIYLLHRSKFTIYKNIINSFLNGMPVQVGYFFDKKLKVEVEKIVEIEQPDHIYCQLIRTANYVKDIGTSKTIDYMDTFSIGAKRWSKHSNWLLKPILTREARKVLAYEQNVFDWFNHHTIISEQDKNLLEISNKQDIHVIPNGVDTDFFQPNTAIEKKYDIAFIGNMGYAPNIKAALFLVKNILPLLQKELPDLKILIAGARPSAEVQKLQSERVEVSGWIDDIREAYASATMFVAPLFIGMGQQNKILEAMAMGVPCITSDLVNNAIGGCPNENILIANDAEAFANQIIHLYKNTTLQQQISENGLNYVRDNFSWSAFVEELNKIWNVS